MLKYIIFVVILYFIFHQNCKERFTNYLNIASKCFSCEKQFPAILKWLGQPSKCFDCQKEYQRNYGSNSVFRTTQQKTFEL